MNKFLLYPLCLTLVGCSYSMNMTHTTGTASGVGDETPTENTTVNPNVSVPISGIPSIPNILPASK